MGGEGGDLGDLVFARYRGGDLFDLLADGVDGDLDAALHGHGVGAGGHVLEALVDDGLGKDGGGGGAVAGDVVGLRRGLLQELGAHVLHGVFEVDFLGDGDAVAADGGGAEFLIEDDVAALGAERHLDRVRERVDPGNEVAARILRIGALLCWHRSFLPPSMC